MRVFGLILAGGQGSRLGQVRKAGLRLGGRTLLERTMGRFGAVAQPLVVATGPGAAMAIDGGVGIADDGADFGGPMAGLRAGMGVLRHQAGAEDIVVTAAVDAPFLPQDYVARMAGALAEGGMAAYARWREDMFPTNAAWRVGPLLQMAPDSWPGSPKALLRMFGATAVDWTELAGQNPFANLNTLADLVALSRRGEDAAQ